MISVFILPSNIIFWKTERERERRESPSPATQKLHTMNPRTHEPIFDFAGEPRARAFNPPIFNLEPSTSPATQSLRLCRKPIYRSLSLCDFDFCVILIFVVVVVVWVVVFWWFSSCMVVGFACLPSIVAFDCRSLLSWVELEFQWCVLFRRWV